MPKQLFNSYLQPLLFYYSVVDDASVVLSQVSWGSSGKYSGDAPQLKGARYFPYYELKNCTNNFSEHNEIGAGGYGKV